MGYFMLQCKGQEKLLCQEEFSLCLVLLRLSLPDCAFNIGACLLRLAYLMSRISHQGSTEQCSISITVRLHILFHSPKSLDQLALNFFLPVTVILPCPFKHADVSNEVPGHHSYWRRLFNHVNSRLAQTNSRRATHLFGRYRAVIGQSEGWVKNQEPLERIERVGRYDVRKAKKVAIMQQTPSSFLS